MLLNIDKNTIISTFSVIDVFINSSHNQCSYSITIFIFMNINLGGIKLGITGFCFLNVQFYTFGDVTPIIKIKVAQVGGRHLRVSFLYET